jgi:hypothetical protein
VSRFVRPEVTRLYLVDVHRRAHEELLKRPKPSATADEIARSARRVAAAEAAGDWIEVRRQLTAGEQRKAFARMALPAADGSLGVNTLEAGISLVTAYLLDWSLKDDDGKVVTIRGVSQQELTSTLDALDAESFLEISSAIQHHETATAAELQEKKDSPTTKTKSEATLPSVE